MNKFVNKCYNKIKNLEINKYKKSRYLINVNKFKKDMLKLFFKNHIDKELLGLSYVSNTIIVFFKHLFNLRENYIRDFFQDIDNHIKKMSEIITQIYLSVKKTFHYNVIQESFITILSRVLIHQIICNDCLYKVNDDEIFMILFFGQIDYLLDNKIYDSIEKLNNDVIFNFLFLKIKKSEKLYNFYLDNINNFKDEVTIKKKLSKRINFITSFLNLWYPEKNHKLFQYIFNETAFFICMLDDLVDIYVDILENCGKLNLVNLYQIKDNKYENYIIKVLLMKNRYLKILKNYGKICFNGSKFENILKMVNSMITNIIGLSLIYNKHFYVKKIHNYQELFENINEICELPLIYIDSVKNSDEIFDRINLYGSIFSYFSFYISKNYRFTYEVLKDFEIYDSVKQDISIIKIKLKNIVNSYLQEKINNDITDNVYKLLKYSLFNTGKMIRPVLILNLFYYLLKKNDNYLKKKNIDINELKNKIIIFCVYVELIHLASLIHDDIIDDGAIRRGKDSINYKFGNNIAVLLGDYLIIESINLLINNNLSFIIPHSTNLTQKLISGEINELLNNFKKIDFDNYLKIIGSKTAIFISWIFEITCKICKICDENFTNNIKKIGNNFGIIFQITDDILDYKSSENLAGKPILNDIFQGVITAPYILAMKEEHIYKVLLEHIKKNNIDKKNFKKKLDSYNFSKYCDICLQYAKNITNRTINLIKSTMGDSKYRENIINILLSFLDRKK